MSSLVSRIVSFLKTPTGSVLVGFAVFGVLAIELVETDFVEAFYDFTRDHEDYDLDEWAAVVLAGIITVAAMAGWQWRVEAARAREAVSEQATLLALERELRQALESSQAESHSKQMLLAAMSHELRTPLNSIIGFSELLSSTAQDRLNAKDREYLGHVLSGGHLLLETVNKVLVMARLEAEQANVDYSDHSVGTLLSEVVDILDVQAKQKSLDLRVEPFEDRRVSVDPVIVKGALFNVIGNAIKFTETGSIRISATISDTDAAICVTDTGPGMTEEGLVRAMRPFGVADNDTYTRASQGTGLGLPITEGMLKAMNGRLELQSTPGTGTRVTLHFPTAPVR